MTWSWIACYVWKLNKKSSGFEVSKTNFFDLEKSKQIKVQPEFSRLLHFFITKNYLMMIGQYPEYLYLICSFSRNKKNAVNEKTQAVYNDILWPWNCAFIHTLMMVSVWWRILRLQKFLRSKVTKKENIILCCKQ